MGGIFNAVCESGAATQSSLESAVDSVCDVSQHLSERFDREFHRRRDPLTDESPRSGSGRGPCSPKCVPVTGRQRTLAGGAATFIAALLFLSAQQWFSAIVTALVSAELIVVSLRLRRK
jgi:hypothetical protein